MFFYLDLKLSTRLRFDFEKKWKKFFKNFFETSCSAPLTLNTRNGNETTKTFIKFMNSNFVTKICFSREKKVSASQVK